MKLEELFPVLPEFTLKATGKSYKLRIPNLDDNSQFKQWAGADPEAMGKVFENLNWVVLSKMIYRLLVDKSDFKGFSETVINDDGVEVNQFVPGPAVMMRNVVGGQAEGLEMVRALIEAMRKGDPLVDKAMREDSVPSDKKKRPKSTGAASLTSSAPSMDTHQSSLAV